MEVQVIKELKRELLIGIVMIAAVLGVFMLPEIIRSTDEEVITDFTKLYFEATPEDYKEMYPNGKFSEDVSTAYISDKLKGLVTDTYIEKTDHTGMVSHVKRAYIKKVDMRVEKMKVSLIRHEQWKDIYEIHGFVIAERREDKSSESLEFKGQVVLVKKNKIPTVNTLFMMFDKAVYFNGV